MEINTNELQKNLLEMMKLFHDTCEKNHLTYYILGGTCLGAIRHKGFIPWDDDMDVGMPRKDYDRFCQMAMNILPSHLEIVYYKNNKKSPFHYIKLIHRNTTLIERSYTNYIEGLYIDVFPLDGMDQYNIGGKIRAKIIWICKALMIYSCTTLPKKELYKKVIKLVAKVIPLSFIHFIVEKLMTINKREKTKLLCNFFGAWEPREIISSSIFGHPTLYSFEDAYFYGPEHAEQYLTSLYGNFMQLPPEKDRICRHNYHYVNLNLPYRDYIKELVK